jgi:hypothetical protein
LLDAVRLGPADDATAVTADQLRPVLQLPTPPRLPGTTGRPPRHGPEFALGNPRTWRPQDTTTTHTTRYGTATATSWDRLHPRLTHRDAWAEHPGELPVIAGTLIRLQVEHLPGDVLPLVGKRRGVDRRDVCPGGPSDQAAGGPA